MVKAVFPVGAEGGAVNELRRCPDHGYFEGEACPACGVVGDRLASADRRRRLSKFMSGALRHFPGDVCLSLDERGWTEYEALVAVVADNYEWADCEAVSAVIATDPKDRFERAGDRVRAAYGHSIDVDLAAPETPVPDRLYHGTDPKNVESIREKGLEPMDRQRVHLSETVEDAREVGRRHAAGPIVLAVDAADMAAEGHRIVRRGRGVYTTDRVLPEYLSVLE